VLVGHSLGGLVARSFLELEGGWSTTRALVTFGTPFRGSPQALDALSNGVRKGPLGLIDLTRLARSCTSVYQLLPFYPVVDTGERTLARVSDASLPNLEPTRVGRGLAFHAEVRRAVESHRRSSRYRERGCLVFPVVGVGQTTPQSARVAEGRLELVPRYRGEDHSGDGTVPRASAIPVERGGEDRAMYAGTRHASLQTAAATLTHLVGLLAGLDIDLGSYRVAPPALEPIDLEVGDAFWSDEPIRVRARVSRSRARLLARVRASRGGAPVARVTLRRARDGGYAAEVGPLRPGSYRVTVTGGRSLEPAEDVFVVAGRPEE
jgi:hypothetical protein